MVTTDDRLHPLRLAETEAQPSAASHEACKGAGDETGPVPQDRGVPASETALVRPHPRRRRDCIGGFPTVSERITGGDNDSWALVPAVLLAIADTQSVRLRLLVRFASPQHPAPAACVYRHTESKEGPRL